MEISKANTDLTHFKNICEAETATSKRINLKDFPERPIIKSKKLTQHELISTEENDNFITNLINPKLNESEMNNKTNQEEKMIFKKFHKIKLNKRSSTYSQRQLLKMYDNSCETEISPRKIKTKTLKIDISELSDFPSAKFNININYVSIHGKLRNQSTIDNSGKQLISPDITKNIPEVNEGIHFPLPSKKWKKLSNLFHSIKSFRRYETKELDKEEEIDEEIKDYKQRLFINTVNVRNSDLSGDETQYKKSLFDSKVVQMMQLQENLTKLNSNNKEEMYKLIVEGDKSAVKKIDLLLKNDPEYYIKDEKHSSFKFNTPLKNGKTLLYTACQEGKIDVVKYLLDKKIDPFIKSKIGMKEAESALQVACRWNYIGILNLLLEKVDYKKENIKEILNMEDLTLIIRKIVKKYYTEKFNKKFSCC